MAKKLDDSIQAKLGNFFEVENEEKRTGQKNQVKWQKDKYILVHVKYADFNDTAQWLLTENEYEKLVDVSLTKTIGKYLEKGKLYGLTIGKCARYIVKIQNLKKQELVIAVGVNKTFYFQERAKKHPASIVKLKKSLFSIFG